MKPRTLGTYNRFKPTTKVLIGQHAWQ